MNIENKSLEINKIDQNLTNKFNLDILKTNLDKKIDDFTQRSREWHQKSIQCFQENLDEHIASVRFIESINNRRNNRNSSLFEKALKSSIPAFIVNEKKEKKIEQDIKFIAKKVNYETNLKLAVNFNQNLTMLKSQFTKEIAIVEDNFLAVIDSLRVENKNIVNEQNRKIMERDNTIAEQQTALNAGIIELDSSTIENEKLKVVLDDLRERLKNYQESLLDNSEIDYRELINSKRKSIIDYSTLNNEQLVEKNKELLEQAFKLAKQIESFQAKIILFENKEVSWEQDSKNFEKLKKDYQDFYLKWDNSYQEKLKRLEERESLLGDQVQDFHRKSLEILRIGKENSKLKEQLSELQATNSQILVNLGEVTTDNHHLSSKLQESQTNISLLEDDLKNSRKKIKILKLANYLQTASSWILPERFSSVVNSAILVTSQSYSGWEYEAILILTVIFIYHLIRKIFSKLQNPNKNPSKTTSNHA